MANKTTARHGTVDFAEASKHFCGLSSNLLVIGNKSVEILLPDFCLDGEVAFERSSGKEAIQALTEINMCFAVGEDKGLFSDEGFGNGDKAGLQVAAGIEDFACEIAVGD